jgi:hypothetical protein
VTSGSWQVLPEAAGLALAWTGNHGRAQGKTNDPATWQALGQRGHLRAMPCATMLRPAASGPIARAATAILRRWTLVVVGVMAPWRRIAVQR